MQKCHTLLPMTQELKIEETVRRRLRSLREARGWSLDELANRAHIGPSTISRIETGQRRLALDHLTSLARALDVSVDELLVDEESDDVVIRPRRDTVQGATFWLLTRPDDPSGRIVAKVDLPARKRPPEPQVHPGRDWFYVVSGTVRLMLGNKEHLVRMGQAAEFDTMSPHSMSGYEGRAEVITIMDHNAQRSHLEKH